MEDNIITPLRLFDQLLKLYFNNDSEEKNLEILIKHTHEILKLKLKSAPKWLLSEFLTLVLMGSLLDDLKIERVERITEADLTALSCKFYKLYKMSASVLKTLCKNNDIPKSAPPVTWLELMFSKEAGFYDFLHIEPWKQHQIAFNTIPVKENFVSSEIVAHIWFHHFQLDSMLALHETSMTDWLNYSDAAAYLKIPESHLISLCLQSKFGAYIPLGDFDVYEHRYYPVTKAKILEIHDPLYLYSHNARGRLLKPNTAFTSKETLKKLYDGSFIGGGTGKLSSYVFLQPSLAEAIQGIIKCVHLSDGKGIGRDKVLFSTIELDAYLSEKKSNHEGKKITSQRNKMIIDALTEVVSIAHKNDIVIEKEKMPGTKKEFGCLLQMVNIKLKCLTATTIIDDYLNPIGYKFRAGTRTGKCNVFKTLSKCVLDSIEGIN